jgi:ornithine carbamoyltransferase
MGKEDEHAKRLRHFKDYQINSRLVDAAKTGVKVMHCLPAHRGEEITDEVMDGSHSIVWDQAENRLHVQKAILEWLMG